MQPKLTMNPPTRSIVVAPLEEFFDLCETLRKKGNPADEKRLIEGTEEKLKQAIIDLQYIFDNLRIARVVTSPRIPEVLKSLLKEFCEQNGIQFEEIEIL